MHIPLLSTYARSSYATLDRVLGRRDPKGGGGGGGGGRGGGGRSGGGRSSGGSKSTTKPAPPGSKGAVVSIPKAPAGKSQATSYGYGSPKVVTIPAGQPFAGRQMGGGTRNDVYGTSAYGSGYPRSSGVADPGFPFYFYPLVWGPYPGYGPQHPHTNQYGKPDNTSRPGGPEMQAAFTSRSSNTTFHVMSDNSTVVALIASINLNCTAVLGAKSSKTPAPFRGASSEPRPEQAVQYYRASSVVLTLDGYNNTAALGLKGDAKPVALPAYVDKGLLDCLNHTIGESVPLFDAGASVHAPGVFSLVVLACFFTSVVHLLF